jgi:hypothetical protein
MSPGNCYWLGQSITLYVPLVSSGFRALFELLLTRRCSISVESVMEVASQSGFQSWNRRFSRLRRSAALGILATSFSLSGCQSYPGLQLPNATRVPPPATRTGAPSAYYGPNTNAPATKNTTQNSLNQPAPVVQASASGFNAADQNVTTANWSETTPAKMLSTGIPSNQPPVVRTADYTDQSGGAPVISAAAVEAVEEGTGQRISDGRSAISGANLQWQQTR